MKKFIVLLLGCLFVIASGACNASSETSESPIAIQPKETAFIVPTSTIFVVPTTISATSTTFASVPETPHTLTYEDCSSGWASWKYGNWTLCSGFENPITIMNVAGKTWRFSYNSHYGQDVKNMCTRLQYNQGRKLSLFLPGSRL